MRDAIKTFHAVIVVVPWGDDRFVFVEETKAECKGLWSLPGGMLEPGESIAEVAVREVREEAGLVVEPTGILRLEHTRYVTAQPEPCEKFRFIVVARHVAGALKTIADAESGRAAPFSIAEARGLALRPGYEMAWLEALERGDGLLPMANYSFAIA